MNFQYHFRLEGEHDSLGADGRNRPLEVIQEMSDFSGTEMEETKTKLNEQS